MNKAVISLMLAGFASVAMAQTVDLNAYKPTVATPEVWPKDKYPESLLYDKPQELIKGVLYTSIGQTAPGTYENAGQNNNLSFIVTKEGVVVVNASDNYLLAKALHDEIKKITEQPVKFVVLENAQGHAMLGSNYWQEQGAKIIAHKEVVAEIEAHGVTVLERMMKNRKDRGKGTKLTKPDIVYEGKHVIELGGEIIEVMHLGPSHSPGDTQVYLPKHKAMIAGDIAFNIRMTPIFAHTDTAGWIETLETKFLPLEMDILIPGHGGPTDKATVEYYTTHYLKYMRQKVGEIIENGGTMDEVYKIDQSRFEKWHTFKELNKINAQRFFELMEFE